MTICFICRINVWISYRPDVFVTQKPFHVTYKRDPCETCTDDSDSECDLLSAESSL